MPALSLARDYILWHYSSAYIDIIYIWWNYLWFVNHLFSVPEVARSLFAPFKRLEEEKVNILLYPAEYFANLFVNIIMRIVGFSLRVAILSIALLGFIVVFFVGAFTLILWSILPALVIHLFLGGIRVFFL